MHDVATRLSKILAFQREYHQRMQDAWSDLLPQLEAIEIEAPSGQVLSPGNFATGGGDAVEAASAIRGEGDDEDETLAEFED